MENGLPFKPDIPHEVAIDACLKELSSAFVKGWQSLHSNVFRMLTHGLRYLFVFIMKYAGTSD